MTSKYERRKPSERNKTLFSKLEKLATSSGTHTDNIIGCGYLRQPFKLKKHSDDHYSLKGYCAKYECNCKRPINPSNYNGNPDCPKESQE
jgi:hypothetical protein